MVPPESGWRTRGRLPHADFAGLTQAITFRLADAMPQDAVMRMRAEVASADVAADLRVSLLHQCVQNWLDTGYGSGLLAKPEARQAVIAALRQGDGSSYRLDGYVVMPNHVHVLAGVGGAKLGEIVRRWKGSSARAINLAFDRSGPLWSREYYDRFIRDGGHLIAAVRYLALNPVKAGLGTAWEGLWLRPGLGSFVAG